MATRLPAPHHYPHIIPPAKPGLIKLHLIQIKTRRNWCGKVTGEKDRADTPQSFITERTLSPKDKLPHTYTHIYTYSRGSAATHSSPFSAVIPGKSMADEERREFVFARVEVIYEMRFTGTIGGEPLSHSPAVWRGSSHDTPWFISTTVRQSSRPEGGWWPLLDIRTLVKTFEQCRCKSKQLFTTPSQTALEY